MNVYYLDTSAWVKLYYDEPGSQHVGYLVGTDSLLTCATLGLVEIVATFSRKHHTGQLATELYDERIREK